jgi:hypothetical protein
MWRRPARGAKSILYVRPALSAFAHPAPIDLDFPLADVRPYSGKVAKLGRLSVQTRATSRALPVSCVAQNATAKTAILALGESLS